MINTRWILALLNGLYGDEAKGFIEYGLSKEQITTKNFGSHTLSAMKILIKQKRASNNRVTFSKVKGFNIYQAIGVSLYYLTREQVTHRNFDLSVLEKMDKIKKGVRPIDYQAAVVKILKDIENKTKKDIEELTNFEPVKNPISTVITTKSMASKTFKQKVI